MEGNFVQDTLQLFRRADEFINNVINQYIVRPTGGVHSEGFGGFVFDIEGDDEITIDSDITDHFVEDNYAIQDHIALRPERFTVKGYVGELTSLIPLAGIKLLTAVQALGSIGAYQQQWTVQAAQVYAQIAGQLAKVGSVVSQAQSIYDIFLGSDTSVTRQQRAFKFFRTLSAARMLCDVDTPWAHFTSMAIERIQVIQRDDNGLVSDFSITFKQIRVSDSAVKIQPSTGGGSSGVNRISPYLPVLTNPPEPWAGRAANSLSSVIKLGSESGIQLDSNVLLSNLTRSLKPSFPPFP